MGAIKGSLEDTKEKKSMTKSKPVLWELENLYGFRLSFVSLNLSKKAWSGRVFWTQNWEEKLDESLVSDIQGKWVIVALFSFFQK